MTLAEMKEKVYSLIEEYNEDSEDLTEDEDLALKMNSVINQVQNELARYKKISAYKSLEVKENDEMTLQDIDKDMYQLNIIRGVKVDRIGDRVIFKKNGTAKIYYYKYPEQITSETDDEYTFELSTDVLEIMPYGVAGDLLKSDVSSQYGTIYSARYRELISQLDLRTGTGFVYLDGGVTV